MSENTNNIEADALRCIELQDRYLRNPRNNHYLYGAIREHMPALLLHNMHLLGIEDVLVSICEEPDKVPAIINTVLSLQCAEQYCGLECENTLIKSQAGFTRTVWKDGQYIGTIDPFGRFMYDETPDLRTLIGWIAVTDGGKCRIFDFNIDEVVETLHAVIRHNEPTQETYATTFGRAVKEMFLQHKITLYRDAYSFYVWHLWDQLLKDANINASPKNT